MGNYVYCNTWCCLEFKCCAKDHYTLDIYRHIELLDDLLKIIQEYDTMKWYCIECGIFFRSNGEISTHKARIHVDFAEFGKHFIRVDHLTLDQRVELWHRDHKF